MGRHEEAIPLLGKAVAEDPQNSDLRCDLALALMHARQIADADREACYAIAAAPGYERCYRVRSTILRNAGRAHDAVIVAREAVRLDPQNHWTLHTLALACIAAKRTREAWALANEVVRLAPERSESHQLLGHAAIGIRKWSVAEQASRDALKLNPNDWAAMNNLGVALQRQRRRQDAARAYDYAAQMNPAAETARRNLLRVSKPMHESKVVFDLAMMVMLPLMAPVVLINWLVYWLRARRTRANISRGAQQYYSSQTISAGFRKLGARDFGIVTGALSFFAWFALVFVVGVRMAASAPRDQALLSLAILVVAAVLASGTGLLAGWLRSRKVSSGEKLVR